MMCWSQKDSFGGTREHRLPSKLEHMHWESCERFIWPRGGCCPSEPGWPLPWISDTFTAKAAASCDRLHKRPLVLSSVVQLLGLHQRKRCVWQSQEAAQEEPGCAQEGSKPRCFPSPGAQLLPSQHHPLGKGKYNMGLNLCITVTQHF